MVSNPKNPKKKKKVQKVLKVLEDLVTHILHWFLHYLKDQVGLFSLFAHVERVIETRQSK